MRMKEAANMHLPIGDLHLSTWSINDDIFGERWPKPHPTPVRRLGQTARRGLVLSRADISWACTVRPLPDLAFIGALPGRKLLLKGNQIIGGAADARTRALAPTRRPFKTTPSLWRVTIGGTRGWLCPNSATS